MKQQTSLYSVSTFTVRKVLTQDQCVAAVRLGLAEPEGAWIDGEASERIRKAQSSAIPKTSSSVWLFDAISAGFQKVLPLYGFDVSDVCDELLFAQYRAGDHFDWHLDIGDGDEAYRKLSMSLSLARSDDLQGGEIEFNHSENGLPTPVPGDAYVFPGYLPHRVHPVRTGVRTVLVAWMLGPRFR
jgi:PKHD-type hydroxylase